MRKPWYKQFYLFDMFDPKHYIRYVDDPPAIEALPEGFTHAQLAGDNWAAIQNSDAFKENEGLRNTKSFDDFVEQYTNQSALLGQDRSPTPKDDWTEDQWAAHFDSLGRPTAAGEYTNPEDMPEIEGFEVNEELMTEAKGKLHGLGLNQKQYAGVMTEFFGWLKNSSELGASQNDEQYSAATEALKKEYGPALEGNVARANALVGEFGSPEAASFLQESGLGNNPHFIKMMVNVAGQFGDDSALGQSLNSNLSGANKAKADIAEMKADKSFAKVLMDETDSGHRQAVARWQEAHKRAFPGVQN